MDNISKNLEEEVDIAPYVRSGVIDIRNDAARDNINTFLNGATAKCFVTPYNAFEKVSKVLANFHVHLNRPPFMEGDRGIQVLDVEQFGKLAGMRDTGEVVTRSDTDYHLYFEYKMNDKGMFDIFAEILTSDEVAEVLSDVEDEMNDEEVNDDREEKLDEAKGSGPLYNVYDKPKKKVKFQLRSTQPKEKKPQYQKDVEDAIDKEDDPKYMRESPNPKTEKHKELSDMVSKWRKKNKMKVADAAIAKGSGLKKKKLTADKAKLVGEAKHSASEILKKKV